MSLLSSLSLILNTEFAYATQDATNTTMSSTQNSSNEQEKNLNMQKADSSNINKATKKSYANDEFSLMPEFYSLSHTQNHNRSVPTQENN